MQALNNTNQYRREFEIASTRSLYFNLLDGQASSRELDLAVTYLQEQIAQVETTGSDLPEEMEQLNAWMQSNMEKVGLSYQQYLKHRKAGEPRRYFQNRSHALHFLKSVAPTKMVDGAWLYGLLERWQDSRFLSLIQTYLEELGEGSPAQNHVALYKRLLAKHGCERWDELSDDHYVQGAIQLSFAYHSDQFLPEVIGFNLGYEQLPLHLLITAYELKELGIDPYYFTLHITVDNGDSGHAKKAVDAVFDAMPKLGDAEDFYRRIRNGYKLNFQGMSTQSVIESFDLDQEMIEIFSRKGAVGRYAHSDYRQIAGRSITQWLSNPDESASLLMAMESEGWFRRHQDPQNSRFWKLISGDKAKMSGVFNEYEQQVIYDWIAGDADHTLSIPKSIPQLRTFEQKQQLRQAMEKQNKKILPNTPNDFDAELQALQSNLAAFEKQEDAMKMLISLMSPANHHSESGLLATRIFADILR